VPLVVPGAAFQTKKYELGYGVTVQSATEVSNPSWPLPPFVSKSPLASKLVTANAGALVSNNNKAVPVLRDLNVEIMANPLNCTVNA